MGTTVFIVVQILSFYGGGGGNSLLSHAEMGGSKCCGGHKHLFKSKGVHKRFFLSRREQNVSGDPF